MQRKRYVGFVYDFTIPGDETFWTEGVLVHNCSPCREHHGRWVCNTDDLAAVYRLYPTGGYVYCLGRERCRGTVVGVWRPQTTGGQ